MNGEDMKMLKEALKEYKDEQREWLQFQFNSVLNRITDVKIAHEQLEEKVEETILKELGRCAECKADIVDKMHRYELDVEGRIEKIEVEFLKKIPKRTLKYVVMTILLSSFIASLVSEIWNIPLWEYITRYVFPSV